MLEFYDRAFMKVVARYFAVLREIVGKSSEELFFDSCHVTARGILEVVAHRHPELSELVSGGLVLLIHGGNVIKELDHELDICSDPAVDLVPPSAGGERSTEARILFEQSVNAEAFLRYLLSKLTPEDGAVAVYFGVVKGEVEGSKVKELRYEYHKDYTEKALERIVLEASKIEGVRYVIVHHSIGAFKPGDVVFAAGVVSQGRKSAIEALREVIERVKSETAIWKIEVREDGAFWVIGNGKRIPLRSVSP
ncbi:MAG: molybdenum cofactor biosynthesis protein MoaE [Sulfolobales archaeon]